MAHIHCCAPLGTNAGVATTVPAFAGFPLGVTQGTYLSQLFSLEDSSFYNPAFVNMQAGGTPAENPRAGVVFLWAPASFKPGTVRGAEISLLSFRQDWHGSEDQALQPVRQQAQLCVRAGLVEPVYDVLDNPAIRPGRHHQLVCCVGIRHKFATYRRFFFSWHLRSVSMGPPHESHIARYNLRPM